MQVAGLFCFVRSVNSRAWYPRRAERGGVNISCDAARKTHGRGYGGVCVGFRRIHIGLVSERICMHAVTNGFSSVLSCEAYCTSWSNHWPRPPPSLTPPRPAPLLLPSHRTVRNTSSFLFLFISRRGRPLNTTRIYIVFESLLSLVLPNSEITATGLHLSTCMTHIRP